ncbi:MAG: J domain-containing protein [archaeon]
MRRIGVNENDIDVPLENMAIKKAKASVTWYLSGHRMHYSHNQQQKFVDNLNVVFNVIDIETNQVLSKKKTLDQFIADFREDADVDKKRIEARDILGLDADMTDWETINKKYRDMAKESHPDTSNGDTESFKKLNNAHKILKRELI